MILIINICKEKLHYYEFIKPIEDILAINKIRFYTKHYKELKKSDLDNLAKVIICGTSHDDNDFVKNIDKFSWIKNINKPVLGICGGMHIIGLVFGGKLRRKTEIGYYKESFNKEFLGLKKGGVYHLHSYYIDFSEISEFEVFSGGKVSQAVKHKNKEIYGVLFHPEVRNKEIIKVFGKIY